MASAELVGVLSMIQSTFESSGVQMEERRISLFRNLRRIFADLEMKERASRQEQITKVIVECIGRSSGIMTFRAIGEALVAVFSLGKQHTMSSDAMSILAYITNKASVSSSSRCGAMTVFRLLADQFGRQLPMLATDLLPALLKLIKNSNDVSVRLAAALCAKDVFRTSPPNRIQASDHIKALCKLAVDKSSDIRCAIADVLAAFPSAVSISNATLETLWTLCLKAIDDANAQVRSAFALTIANIMYACLSVSAGGSCDGQNVGVADTQTDSASKKKQSNACLDLSEALTMMLQPLQLSKASCYLRSGLSEACVTLLQRLPLQTVERFLPSLFNSVISPLSQAKHLSSLGDGVFARTCVTYVVRAGISKRIGEQSQLNFVKILIEHVLEYSHSSIQCAVLCSSELAFVVESLGDAASPVQNEVMETFLPLLRHGEDCVRLCAGLCLRSLAVAVPSQLFGLLSTCLQMITLDNSEIEMANDGGNPVTPDVLTSLRGHSHALAVLIKAAPASSLGIPFACTNNVLETASSLITSQADTCATTHVAFAQWEAGWLLISAFISLGSEWVSGPRTKILSLWKLALARQGDDKLPNKEGALTLFVRSRASALLSLNQFVRSCVDLLTETTKRIIVMLLRQTLAWVKQLKPDMIKSRPKLAVAIAAAKYAMYNVYCCLPPDLYSNTRAQVMQITISDLCEQPDLGVADRSTILSEILNSEDSVLDPPTKVEDIDLNCLIGHVETLWDQEEDLRILWPTLPHAIFGFSGTDTERMSRAAIGILARTLPYQTESNQNKVLEYFKAVIESSLKSTQASSKPPSAVVLRVVSALLLCVRLALRRKPPLLCRLDMLMSIGQLLLSDADVSLRRAGGEIIGCLSWLGDDSFTSNLLKFMVERISVPDATSRCGWAFTLGSIQRYGGSMHSFSQRASSVSALLHLSVDPVVDVRIWALNALWHTIDSAGASAIPYGKQIIDRIWHLFLTEPTLPFIIMQCIGRVSNAVIAALGPELSSQTEAHSRLTLVCQELRLFGHPQVELQYIRCVENLLMFTPQSVSGPEMVEWLFKRLNSSIFPVRVAASSCIRRICERDPSILISSGIDEGLFDALDDSRNVGVLSSLHSILILLIEHLGSSSPSRCLYLCKRVILQTAGKKTVDDDSRISRERDDGDDDDFGESGSNAPEPSTSATAVLPPKGTSWAPRCRSKLFAVECLWRLLRGVRDDAKQFDLARARELKRKGGIADLLVLHLNDLISLPFTVATGSMDSLRPAGLRLMEEVVVRFASTADPDFEGHSILENYQAQLSAALRPAFAPDALPDVTATACSLAAACLSHNVTDDPSVISRIFKLLVGPVESLEGTRYNAYGEAVSTMVQLALLRSMAEVYVSSKAALEGRTLRRGQIALSRDVAVVLSEMMKPHLPLIAKFWRAYVRDYALLSTQPMRVLANVEGTFFREFSVSQVMPFFCAARDSILEAYACMMFSDNVVVRNDSNMDRSVSSGYYFDPTNSDHMFLLMGIIIKDLVSTTNPDSDSGLCQRHLLLLQRLITPTCVDTISNKAAFWVEIMTIAGDLVMQTSDPELIQSCVELCGHLVKTMATAKVLWHVSDGGKSVLQCALEQLTTPLRSLVKDAAGLSSRVFRSFSDTACVAAFESLKHLASISSGRVCLIYAPLVLQFSVSGIFSRTSAISRGALQCLLATTAVAALYESHGGNDSSESGDNVLLNEWDTSWQQFITSCIQAVSLELRRLCDNPEKRRESKDGDQTDSDLISTLLTALVSLVLCLPSCSKNDLPSTFEVLHSCVKGSFEACLKSENSKVSKSACVSLKALLQQSSSKAETSPGLRFLVGHFITDLVDRVEALAVRKNNNVDAAAEVACAAIVVLVATKTIIPPLKQQDYLSMLLQTLTLCIRGEGGPSHYLAGQTLLALGKADPQLFRQSLAMLPNDIRVDLEAGVRAVASGAVSDNVNNSQTVAPIRAGPSLKINFQQFQATKVEKRQFENVFVPTVSSSVAKEDNGDDDDFGDMMGSGDEPQPLAMDDDN